MLETGKRRDTSFQEQTVKLNLFFEWRVRRGRKFDEDDKHNKEFGV